MPVRALDHQGAAALFAAPLSDRPLDAQRGSTLSVPGDDHLNQAVILRRRDVDNAARDLFAW